MMSLKLSRSSSSGKLISHVFGRFSSLMSGTERHFKSVIKYFTGVLDAAQVHHHESSEVFYIKMHTCRTYISHSDHMVSSKSVATKQAVGTQGSAENWFFVSKQEVKAANKLIFVRLHERFGDTGVYEALDQVSTSCR